MRAPPLILLVLLALAPSAAAQGDPRREEAKALFEQGYRLLNEGECGRALDFLLRSRALVATLANSQNAAICLDRLGRHDEAMEMYQNILAEFDGNKLTEEQRAVISRHLKDLRSKLAELEVIADVEGARLFIDARDRGLLPRSGPVFLLPGQHEVRIVKEGYETATSGVTLEPQQQRRLSLRLPALTTAGVLVVRSSAPAEVLLDGILLGSTPLDRLVGAGSHLVQLRSEGKISMPQRFAVLSGQKTEVQLSLAPAGPPLRLLPPPGAVVWLGDVELGSGSWQGALPLGNYPLRVVAEGYHTREVTLDSSVGGDFRISLSVDPRHPRWPRRATPSVELQGGPLLGASTGASAEKNCGDDCGAGWWRGGLLVLRGGYVLPSRLGIAAGVGGLALNSALSRSLPSEQGHLYRLHDRLSSRGPVLEVAFSYSRPLVGQVELGVRLGVLGWLSFSRDELSGVVEQRGEQAFVVAPGSGQGVRQISPALWPEIQLRLPLGPWRAFLGVGALWLLLDGPVLPHRELAVELGTTDCARTPSSVRCLQGDGRVAGERAWGRGALWLPTLALGRSFP